MKRSVAVGCLIACGWVAFGNVAQTPLANRPYARLREQLRAFFPAGYCRSECQDPQKVESDRLIGEASCRFMPNAASTPVGRGVVPAVIVRSSYASVAFRRGSFRCQGVGRTRSSRATV